MNPPKQTGESVPWWAPREVPRGSSLHARLGTLELALAHEAGEWCLSHVWLEDSEAPYALEIRTGGLEAEEFERFLWAGEASQVRLSPILADRPVVIRPRQAVFLPGGEETTMYVSTPVHLRIEVGAEPRLLRELPVYRLSDTWFGPSTREGELCYSDRTRARHDLARISPRPHRAITPLKIRNNAASPLPLEKVSLPVPLLSVYGAADGSLWTQTVEMTRGGASELADIRIGGRPEALDPEAQPLAGPRQEDTRSGLVRAFSLLFGERPP